MSFDEIFDLTAGVYFNFYNIYGPFTSCSGKARGALEISQRILFFLDGNPTALPKRNPRTRYKTH